MIPIITDKDIARIRSNLINDANKNNAPKLSKFLEFCSNEIIAGARIVYEDELYFIDDIFDYWWIQAGDNRNSNIAIGDLNSGLVLKLKTFEQLNTVTLKLIEWFQQSDKQAQTKSKDFYDRLDSKTKAFFDV